MAPSPVRTPRRRRPLGAAILLVWALAWFWFLSRHGGVSWHYFVDGGQLFEDIDSRTGGLHLYGSRPDLQFGPASVVAANGLRGTLIGCDNPRQQLSEGGWVRVDPGSTTCATPSFLQPACLPWGA